ncbi:alpha/beta hydrolase [Saccharothrix sp. S26]|uniref:alpha/beta hydrolase n=1 Tax=Saccharothrix sp. S26 TaxID=2907215 RepID=UPI001F3E1E3F|nr:alpha/beta hydrolase [Saccharothrix sp. S26]MCE6996340.1 alpha/beta hydrolase [Saccharothrix sp. S26]
MALDPHIKQFIADAPEGEVDFGTFTVDQVRTAVDGWLDVAGAGAPLPEVRDLSIPGPAGPVAARLYHPDPEQALPLLVFVVGGGFVANSLEVEDTPVRQLALLSECAVLAVRARNAPEHPYPAPILDTAAALEWALGHARELGADPDTAGVGGHSSGGALAVSALLRLPPHLVSRFSLLALVTPSLGADFRTLSYERYADGYPLTRTNATWFWRQYLGDRLDTPPVDATPSVAPGVERLPAGLFSLAEYDVLHDEAALLAKRMDEAGVPVTVLPGQGLTHGFFYMDRLSPAAASANQRFARRVGRLLRGS